MVTGASVAPKSKLSAALPPIRSVKLSGETD